MDNFLSILALRRPLIPYLPEWFSMYLTYRGIDLQTSFKWLEDYNVLQRLDVYIA